MENSFCGKDCNDCLDKEDVGCPGCKAGPGKTGGSLCEIANCCREQYKENCAGCGMNASCEVLAGRNGMFQKWHETRMNEVERSNTVTGSRVRDGHDAAFMYKTLMTIFFLFVASAAGNVISNVVGNMTGVAIIGSLIGVGAGIAQAVLMIRLGEEERAYKVAGICSLVGIGLSLVGAFLTGVFAVMVQYSGMVGVSGLVFGIVLLVASVVLSVISSYKFMVANGRVVEYRDTALSERWFLMSKLLFAVMGGLVIVPVLIFVLPIVGIIVAIPYVIGVLAFGLCQYAFIYQTAEAFRE